jgi:adenylate cyclase
MKRILVILFTINYSLLAVDCYARLQGQARVDSLLQRLTLAKKDTNKVNLLNELTVSYAAIDPKEGIKTGKQCMNLAASLGWKKGTAKANSSTAKNYIAISDFDEAKKHLTAAINIFSEIGYQTGLASSEVQIGGIYFSKDDYANAIPHFKQAFKIYYEAGDTQKTASTANSIGCAYMLNGDNAEAMSYLLTALEMSKELGNKNLLATLNANMGNLYFYQNDFTKAAEYYKISLELYKKVGGTEDISSLMACLCETYKSQDDNPKALRYCYAALQTVEVKADLRNQGLITRCIAEVYVKQGDFLMGLEYGQEALQIAKGANFLTETAYSLKVIGSTYLALATDTMSATNKTNTTRDEQTGKIRPRGAPLVIPASKAGRLQLAIGYLEQGLDSAKKITKIDVMVDCYRLLTTAYKISGNYKRAFECLDNLKAMNDSVFSKQKNEQIVKLVLQNDFEKKSEEARRASETKLQKQKIFTYSGIALVIIMSLFSVFIIRERRKSENERRKSDSLLLNILPTEVAEELKANGTTTAKHYDNVTVLFTDFVNFTQAAEQMNAQGLIDELHTCFKTFDEITGKYNIEKIKTIGDAYLAVAGLPTADHKHAENIVKAAQEITAFMEDRLGKMGIERTFQVRVGVHSGSVVAGIVGIKKFAYDIWGDTVNTAARMEQNSEAGKINISQTTYELVKDGFNCEYRGEVEVKGKGVMKMYFVS